MGADICIQAGGSLTFQIKDTLILLNPIAGAGTSSAGSGVIQSGTGKLCLNGTNTYQGNTFVQSGTLNLNGSVNGDIHVALTGILSGNAVAHGNIYNAGTLFPGNSIGTHITTDLILFPTSIYDVEVNSAGESDLIIASGSAQIGGGIVVVPEDLHFTAPITYTIINTQNGVTGQFTSQTSSVPALISVIYNPLSVQLRYLPLSSVNLSDNASNIANCFNTLAAVPGSDAALVSQALLTSNIDTINRLFEQMDPAQFSGLSNVSLIDAILVRSTYSTHLQTFWLNQEACKNGSSLWIDSIGQWQNQQNPFGYKDSTLGATIGADYVIENAILGLALSATTDNFHVKDLPSHALINSYYGGIYAGWIRDGFYGDLSVLGAANAYKIKRDLHFGTINRQAQGRFHGNAWLTHMGLGYQIRPSNLQWTPYLNLDYVKEHENGYNETGAVSLDLDVSGKNAALFQGELGVLLSTIYQAFGGELIPLLTLAYMNQTPFYSENYKANLANASCIFTNQGRNYQRNLFAPRIDFTYRIACNRAHISLYYDAKIGSQYISQDVGLDLSLPFD